MDRGAVYGKGLGFLILVYLSGKVIARGTNPQWTGPLLAVLDGANLIFHEASHVFFSFFGDFLQFLGRSMS